MAPSGADDDSPGNTLREIAGGYEEGVVEGVVVAYVMRDGSVRYQLLGALAEPENLGNAVTIAGELKRRLEQSLIFSPA